MAIRPDAKDIALRISGAANKAIERRFKIIAPNLALVEAVEDFAGINPAITKIVGEIMGPIITADVAAMIGSSIPQLDTTKGSRSGNPEIVKLENDVRGQSTSLISQPLLASPSELAQLFGMGYRHIHFSSLAMRQTTRFLMETRASGNTHLAEKYVDALVTLLTGGKEKFKKPKSRHAIVQFVEYSMLNGPLPLELALKAMEPVEWATSNDQITSLLIKNWTLHAYTLSQIRRDFRKLEKTVKRDVANSVREPNKTVQKAGKELYKRQEELRTALAARNSAEAILHSGTANTLQKMEAAQNFTSAVITVAAKQMIVDELQRKFDLGIDLLDAGGTSSNLELEGLRSVGLSLRDSERTVLANFVLMQDIQTKVYIALTHARTTSTESAIKAIARRHAREMAETNSKIRSRIEAQVQEDLKASETVIEGEAKEA